LVAVVSPGPVAPEDTQVAVQRLVELTGTLARRCAQLEEALESRIVIEQAKGVISERFGLEPERAFEVLRRAARSNRVALKHLAERVVSSRSTPWEVAAELDGTRLPSPR
jgi:AmiR/NasT family two-component response regulator